MTSIELLFSIVVDVISKETIQTPDLFQVLSNNVTIFSSFLSSMGVIVSAIVGTAVWLRKKVTEENKELEKRTQSALEKVEVITTQRVLENKIQIENVQKNLCDQIQHNTVNITDRLKDQKEAITDIKNVIEKIDNKLDENQISISRNAARIESHEMRIAGMESTVYNRSSFRMSSNSIDTNNNFNSSTNG